MLTVDFKLTAAGTAGAAIADQEEGCWPSQVVAVGFKFSGVTAPSTTVVTLECITPLGTETIFTVTGATSKPIQEVVRAPVSSANGAITGWYVPITVYGTLRAKLAAADAGVVCDVVVILDSGAR